MIIDSRSRILVTGGAGFIGHHLVKGLLDLGCHVVVLDDYSSGSPENIISHPNMTALEGCVTRMEDVQRASEGVDLTFHLANIVGMKRVIDEPDWTWKVSVGGTLNLFQATGNTPVVVMSSSSVYGLDNESAVAEDDPVLRNRGRFAKMGEHGYARGKWAMEILARRAVRRGRPMMVIRPFNVVGPRQIGQYGMVLPSFVDRAKKGLPLIVYDDGLQDRSFSGVEVVAQCLIRLLASDNAWREHTNVFNVGNPKTTRILDLAHMVIEVTGSKSEIQYKPYDEVFPGLQDVRHRLPNSDHLHSSIGQVNWPDIRGIVENFVAELDSRHVAV